MKILLLNPPVKRVIDPSLPAVLLEEEDAMPPLGLMYLASYLQKKSIHEIKLSDSQLEKNTQEDVRRLVNEYQPDVLGITVMTFTLVDVVELIKGIKEDNSRIKIVLGGPHVHLYPEETANLFGVDYIVLGEGEMAFKDLLDNLDQPEKLREVKGLVFKDANGQIVNTGPRTLLSDLDQLPFPARQLLPYEKYRSSLGKQFPVTTMFTSRGCPYRCLFCDRPHLGTAFRPRSAKNVVDEMQECANLGIKEIFMYDDTFGISRPRVLEITREIKARGIKISWDIRTRVNTVDEEILRELKSAGCERIHYGVEAGTQRILDVLRKGIDLQMVRKAFKLTRQAGIQTLGYFMIGSPTETREDILATIKLAKQLRPDFAHFTITTPYPGTDLYKMGLEKGILPNDYWREFAKNPTRDFKPLIWEENLKQAELVELLKQAYRSFYLRPVYIFDRLRKVSSFKELWVKALMGLKIFRI